MRTSHWTVLTIGVVLAVPGLFLVVGAQPPSQPGAGANLEARVARLEGKVAALESQLAAVQVNHALALDPYVHVDTATLNGVAGPHVIFRGANVHIQSGSGFTDDGGTLTGLGNLIVGYNEEPTFPGLAMGDRGGSHNLITGTMHRYLSFGGLVAGSHNSIGGGYASVSGGTGNTSSGTASSISGGGGNSASGENASVSGGSSNSSSGRNSSILGGTNNIASGINSGALGGVLNKATAPASVVIAGNSNEANGLRAVVMGGALNKADAADSAVGGSKETTVTEEAENSSAWAAFKCFISTPFRGIHDAVCSG